MIDPVNQSVKSMFKVTALTAALLTCVLPNTVLAKEYEPTWESLDSRETPQWFGDAKFGIFIHWGLYSVPAFSTRGSYSEWYWHAKDGDQTGKHAAATSRSADVQAFHNKHYGEDFEYADFRKDFKAELFDPAQWAKVFKRSGAKYVVLTSKHHDGYTLFPSKEASESFGMAWNSVDSGPKRDLTGDLTKAVRDEGLKMGLYYSIWDWFNPYWPEEDQPTTGAKRKAGVPDESREKYIKEVMYPQFKQIVNDYQPAVIFSDGDWWMDDEKWQTKPMLAWLYNNAPNKDEVVINDRWGKVRGKHGGYMTTEYGSGFEDPNILWEENRGIGKSFGLNRIETYDDYNSSQLLTFMLVDIVSRGGNFLLDIGPTADGRIPVIMEDRLIEVGKWLEVNGEAIYGTKRWAVDAQWTEGERIKYTKKDFHHGVPDPIFEMSIMPRPGQSVKELYFTRKDDTLYAFMPKWPGDKLTVKNVKLSKGSTIVMLGSDKTVEWQQKGNNIEVDLSSFGINDVTNVYMNTLKISEATALK
ncbi:alpha-L-fucosidase [Thalassotalea crassostreae]|uniref:alpha-L-fucosidase n=1 Tax=Thalassotalea crassostreae TaxID=1763536 RepID=UPI000AFF3521|nr:alpha-L-fucosidase [Thalassotalea crassostreae]